MAALRPSTSRSSGGRSANRNHQTGIKGLYHIGASTHPGAGLGGGSGFPLAGRL